ncbi:MAG: Na+/H+ antiporter subunit E [Candidatus Aegiribacteria sp.]|nr:Na+/H+ antiporter subunit E [Candidatus Aegiribacteria sp.]
MKSRILMFIIAFAVWCILCWKPDTEHLIAGGVVSLIVAAVMGSTFVTRPHLMIHPVRVFYFLFWYVPVFVWELLKANFDVAYRVVHPDLPIKPGIVRLKTELKSDTGLTFLANSITLTPGTLTIDINKDAGILYIHWINVVGSDPATTFKEIGSRFEPILKKIFEEDVVSK